MRRLISSIRRLPDLAAALPHVLRPLRQTWHRPIVRPTVRLRIVLRRARRALALAFAPPPEAPEGEPSIDLEERFHRALHRYHSFPASAVLGGGLLAALVLVSVVWGLITGDGEASASPPPGTLLAVAGVLATVVGFLMAVTVFALQFHGRRLGRASFLIQYLNRREGLTPIAAIALGVIGANACTALLASLWLPTAAAAMALLDVPLVFITLALSLRLFYRLVTSVAGDFIKDSVIPGLRWELERGKADASMASVTELRQLLSRLTSTSLDQTKHNRSDELPAPLAEIEDIPRGRLDADAVDSDTPGVAEQQDDALQSVATLLAERDRLDQHERLREVVGAAVDGARVEALRSDIAGALEQGPHLRRALRELGAMDHAAEVAEPTRVECGVHVPKVRLLAGATEPTSAGGLLADRLAHEEALRIAQATYTAAAEHEGPTGPVNLPDAVHRAIGRLFNQGYAPSLLFVPRDKAVAHALLGIPSAEAAEHNAFGPDHVGRWQACQVFQWPGEMEEVGSVVVVDAAAFHGHTASASGPEVSLEIAEPNADVHRQWLAQPDADPASVRHADEVMVIAVARLVVGVAVRDPQAAVRIDLASQ